MTEQINCPRCNGTGEITPKEYWATTSARVGPPKTQCPICLGIGQIDPSETTLRLAIKNAEELSDIRNILVDVALTLQNVFHVTVSTGHNAELLVRKFKV